MRNMKATVALATLIAVAAMVRLGATLPERTLPKVHAQDVDLEGCSVATLNGRYGLTFHGFSTNSAVLPVPIGAFVPVAGGGVATFDRNGNLSISETVNLGGQLLPLTLSGSYTVNADCTGSITTTSGVHLKTVIVRNGREILAVNTDPGRVAVDNFIKQ